MDWEEIYHKRTMTAEEAVSQAVKSGDHIFVAQSVAEPFSLTDALAADYKRLKDVEIFQNRPIKDSFFITPESEGHIKYNLIFVGGTTRKAVVEGKADFTPIFLL
jgi:Acetyl-CoA hydrolase